MDSLRRNWREAEWTVRLIYAVIAVEIMIAIILAEMLAWRGT